MMNPHMLTTFLWTYAILLSLRIHLAAGGDSVTGSDAMVNFSSTWQVLGPFQIGTREAIWGADPLEAYGGFRELSYDAWSTFPSSLASKGSVKWSKIEVKEGESSGSLSRVVINVAFENIEWPFLRSIYGWPALQYQAWARGNLSITGGAPKSVILYTDNVLELWIDGLNYFGGDFYAFHRAPLVLQLDEGIHQVDVRLIRDVRAMGGGDDPQMTVVLEAIASPGGLQVDNKTLLISDVVSGKLPSQLASVTVRNEGTERIDISDIVSADGFSYASIFRDRPVSLAPGASRPLMFNVALTAFNKTSLSFRIVFGTENGDDQSSTSPFSCALRQQSLFDPHKFTFLHPSGIVSYAILRPPSERSRCTSQRPSYPVLVNLHGAGLEANSEQVRHMLDAVPDLRAWLLFPSGVTSWSGDDWHNWGFGDVQAAIDALPQWIDRMDWSGPKASTSDWLVSGHSNGGQGTWYILSHYPDKVIAATPVSGYTSIQAYVPYNMWMEADSSAQSVLQGALSSYRHEILVQNFVGIPLLLQHGSADDNVPVFHSRRMYQLLSETKVQQSSSWRHLGSQKLMSTNYVHPRVGSWSDPQLLFDSSTKDRTLSDIDDSSNQETSTNARLDNGEAAQYVLHPKWKESYFDWPLEYAELAGKGHWFDGVMTTSSLKDFYEEHLNPASNDSQLPLSFSIRVPGSGIMGSRGGVVVDQVLSPDQDGELDVFRDEANSIWHITTFNIKRFHISVDDMRLPAPGGLVIDGEPHTFPLNVGPEGKEQWFTRSRDVWEQTDEGSWHDLSQRYGRQRGALAAILLTRDRFTILSCSNDTYRIAAQIGRNLFQYYGADSVILIKQDQRSPLSHDVSGNVIIVASGADLPPSELSDYPLRIEGDRLILRQNNAAAARRYHFEPGLGAVFLRPLRNQRLELVVWGADQTGLQQAARLVPTLTGSGQPDFAITSRSCLWKGLGGVYAAGFFDSSWAVSRGSFIK